MLSCRGGEAQTQATTRGADDAAPARAAKPAADAAPPPAPLPYLGFDGACAKGKRAVVAVAGDVLMHHELQRQAVEHRRRYRSIWAGVADLLEAADVTYANVEGPIAPGLNAAFEEVPDPGFVFDEEVYTGYPRFNYHRELGYDLKRSGVDVVSTANNHTFDRGSIGVDRTIEWLRDARLKLTGTTRTDELDAEWYTITTAGPLKIAWLACTAFTNIAKLDEAEQVLRCKAHADEIAALVKQLSRRRSIDAVIITPHWGNQYSHEQTEQQIQWAHQWLDAGATAVVGSHPHVLQPWEKYVTKDGRETLILYSLGNFASHQPELQRRSGALFYFGLVRGRDKITRISGVRYVPLHVRQTGDRFYVEAIDRVGGPAEARQHITSIFSPYNVIHPDDNLVMDPQCAEHWQPSIDPLDYVPPLPPRPDK